MKLWKLCFVVTTIFWPLSLYLGNPFNETIVLFSSSILLGLFLLFKKSNFKIANYILLTVPLIEPKLVVFPIIYFLFEMLITKQIKTTLLFLVAAIAVLAFKYNLFWGHTIFKSDYQAQQEILRNITLYPNIPLARLFQNKAVIVINKFWSNLFSLLDPNNYFFGFAPRQIVENQNLIKFPFMAIFIFLYSLFGFQLKKTNIFFICITVALLLNLSILTNFDKTDFVLWIPLSVILFNGFIKISKLKHSELFLVTYLIFSLTQFIRILTIN